MTQSAASWWSSEAFGAAALLAAPRLPPQAGGRIPLAVDESPEWSGGGSPTTH
ncbi:MAG: hypothetical protein IIB44_11335 [Candidatus Marinimicrobia bacterium]|nr:hypothetical protein [Candidatus Neomarinimicrobiota bacterium]